MLTEADISQARALIAAGQFEAAIAILVSRPPAPDNGAEALALTAQATVELALRDPDEERQERLLSQAVEYYHILVSANPDIPYFRLELARAFFNLETVLRRKGVLRSLWDNKDSLAKEQFERVLAEDPPQAVQQNVNGFLARIKARRRLQGWVRVSTVRDTNFNSQSADKTIWINAFGTRLPFQSDSEPPKSGLGLSFSGGAIYSHPVREKLSLQMGAQLLRRDFPGSSSDSTYLELSFGPEYQLSERSDVELLAVAGYNHQPESQFHRLGIRARTSHSVSFRTFLQTNLGVYRQKYHPSPENSSRDADEYEVGVSLRHRLSATFNLDGGISYALSRVDASPDSDSRNLRGSVGLSKDFRNGLTAGLSVSVSRTDYRGVVGAPTIDGLPRTDRSRSFEATLYRPGFTFCFLNDSAFCGFSPQLVAGHDIRTSNSQAVDYTGSSLGLDFVKQF